MALTITIKSWLIPGSITFARSRDASGACSSMPAAASAGSCLVLLQPLPAQLRLQPAGKAVLLTPYGTPFCYAVLLVDGVDCRENRSVVWGCGV